MQLRKTVQRIPHIYRVIAGLLIMVGLLGFCKRAPYVMIFEENQQYYRIPFLQEGQYEFYITYERLKPGDKIQIYSNSVTNDLNRNGIILGEAVVPEHSGIVSLYVTLPGSVRNIYVTNGSQDGYFAQGKVQSVGLQNRDSHFLLILFCLLAFLFLAAGYRNYMGKHPIPFLLIGLGLSASLPLFSDFLYWGDDTYFHLARIEGIFQSLRGGQFPVRLNAVQNKGYGDLSASMYPSLCLMPFVALRFLNVSLMLCYKVMIVCVNIATAAVSYYSVKRLCNSQKAGMWACVLYTFSAYRLNDLYMRSAIGEAMAMIFFPLLIWGTYEVLWGEEKRWYILMLGMTGVIQTHVLSTEFCVLFMAVELVIWFFCGSKKKFIKRICSGLRVVVITILLNACFLIPFFYFSMQDLQCMHMENYIAEFPAYFTQMFAVFMPATGTTVPVGSTQNEMALSAGFVLLAGAVLFCVNQIRDGKDDSEMGKTGRRCFGYGVACLILSSWLFPWSRLLEMEWFRLLSSPLQFSWRFLGPASAFLCVVTAIAVETTPEKLRNHIKLIAAGLLICSTGYCFDMLCQQRDVLSDKMEVESIDLSDSMYMYYISDKFEPWHLRLSRDEAVITCLDSSEVAFSEYEKRGLNISVTTQNRENAEDLLIFPLCYYPGYAVRVDGERVETKVHYAPIPMVACDLPDQTAHITVSYEGLWIFRAGDILTLVTAAGLTAMAFRKRKRAGASS